MLKKSEKKKHIREQLQLKEKLKIINMIEKDKFRVTDVAKIYNKNESSIRQILRDREKIKQNADLFPYKIKVCYSTEYGKIMLELEQELFEWMDKMHNEGNLVNFDAIRDKSTHLYEDKFKQFKSTLLNEKKYFIADKNWIETRLTNYKLRNLPQNNSKNEQSPRIAEIALPTINFESYNTIQQHIQKMVNNEAYNKKQIFCVDEMGLYWKKLPASIIQHGIHHLDRLTLIMCCNVTGHMIKPALIYRNSHPKALRNKHKNTLPVYWLANSKMRVTATLFLEWFHQCFKPAVQNYLELQRLDFKVLLLVNKLPWHPGSLVTEDEHIKIVYLPAPMYLQLQPLQQGILRLFKINYFRKVFKMLYNTKTLSECFEKWYAFSIVDALVFIQESLEEVDGKTITSCWEHILWGNVNGKRIRNVGIDGQLESLLEDIKMNSLEINMDLNKLGRFLDEQEEFLSDEDLRKVNTNNDEIDDDDDDNDDDDDLSECFLPSWTFENFERLFSTAECLTQQIIQNDPNMERSIRINKQISNALNPLQILFTELKRQQQQQQQLQQETRSLSENAICFVESPCSGTLMEPELQIINMKQLSTDVKDPIEL